MSLQVNDPRSRGRSKSPSGRTRERSTSRQSYRDSGSVDEKLRSGSRDPRSRDSSAIRGHRSRSRYDASDSDEKGGNVSDWYRSKTKQDRLSPRPRPRRDDRYYHSGGEEDGDKAAYRPQRPKYESESEESDSSVDDRLAYGDMPGDRKSRSGRYKFWSSPRVSSSQLSSQQQPPPEEGHHPSYARPGPFKYTNPLKYLHGQPTTSAPPSNWAPAPECELPGFVPPSSQAEAQAMPGAFPPHDMSSPVGTAPPPFPMPHYMNNHPANPYASQSGRPLSVPASAAYNPASYATTHHRTSSGDTTGLPAYAQPAPFQYAQVDPNVRYSSKNSSKPFAYSTAPQFSNHSHSSSTGSLQTADVKHSSKPQYSTPTTHGGSSNDPRYIEITPGGRLSGRPHSHSVSSGNNLTVAQPDPSHRPASPLQEPYRGTYQSISPMPSPIVIPSRMDDDISDVEPLESHKSDLLGQRKTHRRKKSSDDRERKESKHEGSSTREKSRVRHERHSSTQSLEQNPVVLISPGATPHKRVSFYDPTPDALATQEALSHTRHIDHKTLIRILPHLGSEDMLDLRKEYKQHVKLHGKGINLAKHLRLKLGNSAFGKACYATALGRWESEAHWANCYYQSGSSRRELLIESLMGRSNSEIRSIKESFRDSRYLDSLEKCMKAELKADKFRTAVLLALDERRQSEREPLDAGLIERDLYELHRALVSRDGGETAMIFIIVRRSDAHLREVLRIYERTYRQNFAKAMIAKSQNLVGETLAHILNGAINRPMRDALLLHQALRESRTGKERLELLISRLIRLHWEPRHLEQVKQEFRKRYRERLEEAIAEEVLPINGGSEWGEFCIELARSSSAGGR